MEPVSLFIETTEVFTKLSKTEIFSLTSATTIVVLESNIILNPLYNFGKVEVIKFINLPIDERLKSDKQLLIFLLFFGIG
jgi:hypothetical protein